MTLDEALDHLQTFRSNHEEAGQLQVMLSPERHLMKVEHHSIAVSVGDGIKVLKSPSYILLR